jgi:hypothetical protein
MNLSPVESGNSWSPTYRVALVGVPLGAFHPRSSPGALVSYGSSERAPPLSSRAGGGDQYIRPAEDRLGMQAGRGLGGLVEFGAAVLGGEPAVPCTRNPL